MNPLFSIIKRVETPVNEHGEQRECALYKKEGFFAVECVEGTEQAFYKEFAKEEEAAAAYDNLLSENTSLK